jgi:hypothetical protein
VAFKGLDVRNDMPKKDTSLFELMQRAVTQSHHVGPALLLDLTTQMNRAEHYPRVSLNQLSAVLAAVAAASSESVAERCLSCLVHKSDAQKPTKKQDLNRIFCGALNWILLPANGLTQPWDPMGISVLPEFYP